MSKYVPFLTFLFVLFCVFVLPSLLVIDSGLKSARRGKQLRDPLFRFLCYLFPRLEARRDREFAEYQRPLIEAQRAQERAAAARAALAAEQAQKAEAERRRSEKEKLRAEQELDQAVDDLLGRHGELVERFMEVATRKVSRLDEYGDESWDELPKESPRCVAKILAREEANAVPGTARVAWEAYTFRIRERLESRFRGRYDARKSTIERFEEIDELSGEEFESFLSRLLPHFGFSNIRGTPKTGDQGADLLADVEGKRAVIQAKRQRASVGNGAVQEAIGAMSFYDANAAWVITNSTFTDAARDLANRAGVRLVDRTELGRMIQAQNA